jgi:hypothetical protein
MPSLVRDLQYAVSRSNKSVTEILRTAKLISAKLGLNDITGWIESELNGYKKGEAVPEYRQIKGGHLEIFNPYQGGWIFAGNVEKWRSRTSQPVPELEELASGETIIITPDKPFPLMSIDGMGGDHNFPQRLVFSPVQIKRILEAIKDKILDWTIELEQRGILGDDMSFDKEEKQKAHQQIFNIQNFTGVLGDVKDSSVTVYDYSSIHQVLRNHKVPQRERNEIENILDGLKQAKPDEKASLLEKGKDWIVKNHEFLGASASIVRKALGL